MIRRKLTPLLRLLVAATAGGEDNCARVDHMLAAVGAPSVLARLEREERAPRQGRSGAGLERLAQRGRDRVTRSVAHLQKALPRGTAAAREPVATVLPREVDAQLLEPMDRRGRLR